MKASTDETSYFTAWQETPFGSPKNPESESEAFKTAGCHVKSRNLEPHRYVNGWPCYFGRLASYSERVDNVVVISKAPAHGVDGRPTVWTGTFAEYSRMWECD